MLNETILALEMVRPLAKMVPGVGTILEGSIEAVTKFASVVRGAKVLKQDWLKLAERAAHIMAAIIVSLYEQLQTSSSGKYSFDAMSLLQTLESCHAAATKAATTNVLKAFLRLDKYRQELSECSSKLEDAIVLFGIQSHIYSAMSLNSITTKLLDIHLKIQELFNMSSYSFNALNHQMDKIQDSVAHIPDHDGMHYLFLLSDFSITKTYSHPEDEVQQHNVKHRQTEKCYVLRQFKHGNLCGTQTLNFLKEHSHSNIEQLIGYSRNNAPGHTFYVTDAVGDTYTDLMKKSSKKQRIQFFIAMIQQYHNLNHATTLAQKYSQGYSSEFVWEDGKLIIWSQTEEIATIAIRFSSSGQLVFTFPPLPYRGHCYHRWIPSQDPDHYTTMSVMDSNTRAWIQYLDQTKGSTSLREIRWLYTSHLPGILSPEHLNEPGTLTPQEIAKLPCFVPSYITTRHVRSSPWKFPLRYWELSNGQRCYELDAASEHHRIHLKWDCTSVWSWLSQHAHVVAAREGLELHQIEAAIELWESWRIIAYEGMPNITALYFITYPLVDIGPAHVLPGYLATSPESDDPLHLVSWSYAGDRWGTVVEFHGLEWGINRTTMVHYAQLTKEELQIMEEDNYWGDHRRLLS